MVKIRIARKDEVGELQNLNDKAFIDNPKYDEDFDSNWSHSKYAKEYFTELLNNNRSVCMIVEDGSTSIGYAAVAPKPILYRHSRYCEIQNIGIIPEYRKRGIGKKLMPECFKWARSQGYQKIYLNSFFNNKNAIEFYKKNGFSEINISLEKTL